MSRKQVTSRHFPGPLRKGHKPIQKQIGSTPGRKKSEYLSICVVLLSLLGTFMSLVGYGVSLSVDELGIPPESIFTSPFEVIGLSIWAVNYFFRNLEISQLWSVDYYIAVLFNMRFFPIFGCVGIGIGVLIWKFGPRFTIFKTRHPRLARTLALPSKRDGPALIAAKGMTGVLFLWIVIPAVSLLILFLVASLSVLLASVPIIGYAAGRSHIDKDVMKPVACSPVKNREVRIQPRTKTKSEVDYARCVVVKTDRMPEGLRGRVVFDTSSNIVLFDPRNGIVTRIPIRDMTIQAIDTL